jgi:hypothetical protein
MIIAKMVSRAADEFELKLSPQQLNCLSLCQRHIRLMNEPFYVLNRRIGTVSRVR